MTTAAGVQQVLDEHPALSWLGYGGNGEDITEGRAQLLHPDSIATIATAAAWAREHLGQRRDINRCHTSYGLKHLAEQDIGYTTNGQFITAMLLAGFRMRPSPRGANPSFNITERSARALQERRQQHNLARSRKLAG